MDESATAQIVRRVLEQTGGHPYLTAWMCDEFQRRGYTKADEIPKLADDLFSSLDAVRNHVHFETILRFIGERLEDQWTTLQLYRRIWRGRPVTDETTHPHVSLKLAGLAKRSSTGHLVVRNPIYRRLFTNRLRTLSFRARQDPLFVSYFTQPICLSFPCKE